MISKRSENVEGQMFIFFILAKDTTSSIQKIESDKYSKGILHEPIYSEHMLRTAMAKRGKTAK